MKAIVIKESNNILFEEVEDITPKGREVKVLVKYTGICGSDVPRALNNGAHNYPIILGHEFSGVVVSVGADVKNVKVSDHIVGIPLIPCMKCDDCQKGNYSLCGNYSFIGSRRQGSMAEYIVLPEDNVFVIDKSIPLLSAAFFEPSTVAYHGIKLSGLENKDNACVIGTGNISIFTIQWLRIMGVKNITVIGRNEERLKTTIKYGANNIININDDDYQLKIDELTNNQNFINVYECTGAVSMIKKTFELTAKKGHICLIGTPRKNIEFTIKEWELLNRRELTLKASWMSYSNPFPGEEWIKTEEQFKWGNLVVNNDLIYKIYPMKDGSKAFNEFKNNVTGKIVIENEYYKG